MNQIHVTEVGCFKYVQLLAPYQFHRDFHGIMSKVTRFLQNSAKVQITYIINSAAPPHCNLLSKSTAKKIEDCTKASFGMKWRMTRGELP